VTLGADAGDLRRGATQQGLDGEPDAEMPRRLDGGETPIEPTVYTLDLCPDAEDRALAVVLEDLVDHALAAVGVDGGFGSAPDVFQSAEKGELVLTEERD
jgi:hypothetical protein